MRLWVDGKNRSYGLEEETGYSDVDTRAVEFTVHEDLALDLITPGRVLLPNANPTKTQAAKALLARSKSPHRNLPSIRFEPDGSLDENNPQSVRLYDRNGADRWVALSRDHLNYEIRTEAN